jgi:UV excision repair protein RAD23
LIGSALQTAIDNLVEMGFEREQVQRAMRASFNNPERAVEYLTTVRILQLYVCELRLMNIFKGIPAHLEQEASGQAAAQPAAQPQQGSTPASTQQAPAANTGGPQNLFQVRSTIFPFILTSC